MTELSNLANAARELADELAINVTRSKDRDEHIRSTRAAITAAELAKNLERFAATASAGSEVE